MKFIILGKVWDVNSLSKLNSEIEAVTDCNVSVTAENVGKTLEVVIPLILPTTVVGADELPEAVVMLLLGKDNMPLLPHFPFINMIYSMNDVEEDYKRVAKSLGVKVRSLKVTLDPQRGIVLSLE